MSLTESLFERAYYLLRAEAELRMARQATHEAAARAHFHIAGLCLDKAHREFAGTAPRSA